MRRLGQHFLKNQNAVRAIVHALALEAGDTIIEIGSGHGELTKPILEDCETKSCAVVAIEKDSRLALDLFQFKNASFPNVAFKVLEGDARVLLKEIVANYSTPQNPPISGSRGKLPITNYKIVGNIPYYITGNLLRIISELESKPACAVLMLQKEVGERLMASPPRMNLLAAATQIWADVSVVCRLAPHDFAPSPKVASLVLKFTPHAPSLLREEERERYYQFIKNMFRQPRKTILNNLESGLTISRAEIETILVKQGVSPRLRPQNLSIQNLITLSSCF